MAHTHTHLDKTNSTFCARFMIMIGPCKFETTAFQGQKGEPNKGTKEQSFNITSMKFIWQVRWIDQIQYPISLVASLDTVPVICCVPLQLKTVQVLLLLRRSTHTPSPRKQGLGMHGQLNMTWHEPGEPWSETNHQSPRRQDKGGRKHSRDPKQLYSSNKPSRNTTSSPHTHRTKAPENSKTQEHQRAEPDRQTAGAQQPSKDRQTDQPVSFTFQRKKEKRKKKRKTKATKSPWNRLIIRNRCRLA